MEENLQEKTREEILAEELESARKALDDLRRKEEARRAEERRRAEEAQLSQRFDAALGERRLLHPRLKELLLKDFGAALKEAANAGLSDEAVLEAVCRDQGCFASQTPPLPDMPAPGRIQDVALGMRQLRRVMGIGEQA